MDTGTVEAQLLAQAKRQTAALETLRALAIAWTVVAVVGAILFAWSVLLAA